MWRVDGGPRRMSSAAMPLESRLEELIESDPTILGQLLLFIGRQVPTAHGKFIDLLAIDGEGVLHVLELKRDRTPRDVVAQALELRVVGGDALASRRPRYLRRYKPDTAFEVAFSDVFGSSPPEELNTGHRLTVVASEVDPATARIVEYLAEFGVALNVVFFRYFVDGDREYLARTWLFDDVRGSRDGDGRTREPWNEQDWYVSFGEEDSRSWDDARRFGFVSAGGGNWYSRTLRNLPVDARVFVCIPGSGYGYVGVGTVKAEAMRFDEAVLTVEGTPTPMRDLELEGTYRHGDDSEDMAEYVVPVQWIKALQRSEAFWEKGLFANQNSACKLRNRFTLDALEGNSRV